MTSLTIVQHNVNTWTNKRHSLCNIYNKILPDIIILNDTSIDDKFRLTIFNYNTYQCNKTNLPHRGVAIAIRHNINHRLDDDFHSDILAVTIETRQGPLTIATTYIPPKAPYINFIDFLKLLNNQHPTYMIGDLNARYQFFGHNDSTPVGRNLKTLFDTDKARYVGPNFPTLIKHNSAIAPDIVITNNKAFHNIHLPPDL